MRYLLTAALVWGAPIHPEYIIFGAWISLLWAVSLSALVGALSPERHDQPRRRT